MLRFVTETYPAEWVRIIPRVMSGLGQSTPSLTKEKKRIKELGIERIIVPVISILHRQLMPVISVLPTDCAVVTFVWGGSCNLSGEE